MSDKTDNFTTIFSLIDKELELVSDNIKDQLCFSNSSSSAAKLADYVASWNGKMLRPGLLLLSGIATGGINKKHIQTAAVVEIIHLATLIHDDVIDNGQVRRGQVSVNDKWGNENAVMLGDLLLVRAFKLLLDIGDDRIHKIIGDTTERICAGEVTQNFKKEQAISNVEYFEIIQQKTASMFETACLCGAILNNTNEQTAKQLGQFGLKLGMAFQIRDDLRDIIASTEKAGKTIGRDIQNGKFTLSVLDFLNKSDKEQRTHLDNAVKNGRDICELLEETGSIDYTKSILNEYLNNACYYLNDIDNVEAKECLIGLCKILKRN